VPEFSSATSAPAALAQPVADPAADVALPPAAVAAPVAGQPADDLPEGRVHPRGVGLGERLECGVGAPPLGQHLDQASVVGDDAVVGDAQVEAAQVLGVAARLHDQDAADQARLAGAAVGVAADDHVQPRPGQVAGQLLVDVEPVVGEQHQQVGLRVQFGDPAPDHRALVVQPQARHAHVRGHLEELGAGHADHAHAQAAALEDHGLLREHQLAALVAQVQGHDRPGGAGGQAAGVVAALVEVVVADRPGVDTQQVEHVDPTAARHAVDLDLADGVCRS
jgi:hypothetical protein